MHELMGVWATSRQEGEAFRRRVRVLCLPDARIGSVSEKLRVAKHWKARFAEVSELSGEDFLLLGPPSFQECKAMREFASKVGEILDVIADMLRPTDVDQLVADVFDDHSSAA